MPTPKKAAPKAAKPKSGYTKPPTVTVVAGGGKATPKKAAKVAAKPKAKKGA